jgi:hypothetical protein
MPPPIAHGLQSFEDRLDRLAVFRAARKRTVQIDHMQELAARSGKNLRLRGGVVAIDGGARHIALGRRTT